MDRMQPPPYYGAPYQGEMPPSSYPYPTPGERKGENEQTATELSGNYFAEFMEKSVGKRVSIFCSFTDSAQWHDEVFTGLLEVIGDDFVVIKDTALNKSTLIMSVYINYIEITTETKKK
ncbi:MAG: spore coat protein GerQ [Bacilli bacterium]